MKDSSEGETLELLGAQLLQSLMARHQVPDRQRSNWIERILGLSYHAAHRRVHGLLPITIEELAKVANHFGETVADAVLAFDAEKAKPAIFVVGGFQEPCKVWIGDSASTSNQTSLIAQEEPSGWVVKPATNIAASDLPPFSVKRMVFEPQSTQPFRRVAVVDDSLEIAESVGAYLRGVGFATSTYLAFEPLMDALSIESFDAYIVDWLIGPGTARALLAQIRAKDPHCPIIVLTGQARSGQANVGDLASALATYQATFYEKPAQTPIIGATLFEAFRSAPSGGGQRPMA